jgi:hypothetical protein
MTQRECERVRVNLMAWQDGERGPDSAGLQEHVASCASCREWLAGLEMLDREFSDLTYAPDDVDLWAAVHQGIRQPERAFPPQPLWAIAALLVAWRALQLLVDLPLPVLHVFVPLAVSVVMLWRAGGDVLRIETSAPELQKRGI